MRVLAKDAKAGSVKLRTENLDDLWHLSHLVAPGDHVASSTWRTAEPTADKLRAEKLPKQRVTLTLEVERIEFAEFSDRLRILGRIVDGPRDLGQHHTIAVEADGGEPLTLRKPGGLRSFDWERIDEAVRAAKRPLVTIVSMDDEEAAVAVLRQYGVQTVAVIKGRTAGKQYDAKDEQEVYFREVLDVVARTRTEGTPLIVVGPGFVRENFLAFARERDRAVVEGAVTEGTGQAGGVGVQEALKRGIVERIQQDQQVAVDTRRVEAVFSEIARDGAVAYGPEQVQAAVSAGAVERLVVTDLWLRSPDGATVLERARHQGAKVHVVATAHEAGKKLESLGGAAAHLRFRLSP